MTTFKDPPYLTGEKRLLLHQLRLYEWMQAQIEKDSPPVVLRETEADDEDVSVPKRWELTKGIHLYSWQEECIERWFKRGFRGTVKVVTGGGKTILGLAIAQRLQNDFNSRLRVAVVVPTVVLMHQWYDELIARGNLPAHALGRLGGGYTDDFTNRRVLIIVLASAHKQLPRLVRSGRNSKRLLLIADECHRAGAAVMSRVFKTQRPYTLGLSATPERDEDEGTEPDTGYDDSLLGRELGPIIYDFNLSQALELGVVPRFTIRHYGLPLAPEERSRYSSLSRSISERQSELRALAPQDRTSGAAFFSWARRVAGQSGRTGNLASGVNADVTRRKELLQRAAARGDRSER
ncbi:MAG: DEAD/DEAH box helicase family protein, partial [Dehalococcoidia bacterium]|nr:DEAD/DEAH box helicase family protein [Dehalococcoidia bacterium]